jgi:hypothetical protein
MKLVLAEERNEPRPRPVSLHFRKNGPQSTRLKVLTVPLWGLLIPRSCTPHVLRSL